jgi:hypothetical protein
MKKTILCAIAISFSLSAQAQVMTPVTGRIVDQAGNGLAGATVAFNRVPKLQLDSSTQRRFTPASGETYFSTVAITDLKGSAATTLPAGNYYYCARAAGYLDSCVWGQTASVLVQNGTPSQLPVLSLKKGLDLVVTVKDAQGLLKPWNSLAPGLSLGVFRVDGSYVGAVGQQSAGGWTYHVTIPPDEHLDLWAHSLPFLLQDATGTAIPGQGMRVPIPLGSAAVPAAVTTLHVVGKR